MATSYQRGHVIFFDWHHWIWCYEDGVPASIERSCVRCGNMPTSEGHDACLGELPGVEYACCGHGVGKSVTIKRG